MKKQVIVGRLKSGDVVDFKCKKQVISSIKKNDKSNCILKPYMIQFEGFKNIVSIPANSVFDVIIEKKIKKKGLS